MTFTVTQSSGCSFSISPAAQAVGDGGGPGSVAVSTSPGCVWTAASSAPWARITSGPSGTGAGNVAFIVDPTPTSLPRSTTLSIAGQTFTISQAGAPCLYVLSPAFVSLQGTGGSGIFEVNTPEGCTWTAVSNDAWLHVTAGASGSGDGTVSFSADANLGSVRTGTIVAGGRAFTASQAAAGALRFSPDLLPTTRTLTASTAGTWSPRFWDVTHPLWRRESPCRLNERQARWPPVRGVFAADSAPGGSLKGSTEMRS